MSLFITIHNAFWSHAVTVGHKLMSNDLLIMYTHKLCTNITKAVQNGQNFKEEIFFSL